MEDFLVRCIMSVARWCTRRAEKNRNPDPLLAPGLARCLSASRPVTYDLGYSISREMKDDDLYAQAVNDCFSRGTWDNVPLFSHGFPAIETPS